MNRLVQACLWVIFAHWQIYLSKQTTGTKWMDNYIYNITNTNGLGNQIISRIHTTILVYKRDCANDLIRSWHRRQEKWAP
jgi:hypothetical protein